MVVVEKDGKEQVYVLDPSLYKHPVPIEEWLKLQAPKRKKEKNIDWYRDRFQYRPSEATRTGFTEEIVGTNNLELEKFLALQDARKKK